MPSAKNFCHKAKGTIHYKILLLCDGKMHTVNEVNVVKNHFKFPKVRRVICHQKSKTGVLMSSQYFLIQNVIEKSINKLCIKSIVKQ